MDSRRALMNTQQAPSPVQASRELPSQSAWIRLHCNAGHSTMARTARVIRVTTPLSGVLKRLALSQPSAPLRRSGGRRAAAISVCNVASPISALLEHYARVIDIHRQRHQQTDQQIDAHGDGYNLDGL